MGYDGRNEGEGMITVTFSERLDEARVLLNGKDKIQEELRQLIHEYSELEQNYTDKKKHLEADFQAYSNRIHDQMEVSGRYLEELENKITKRQELLASLGDVYDKRKVNIHKNTQDVTKRYEKASRLSSNYLRLTSLQTRLIDSFLQYIERSSAPLLYTTPSVDIHDPEINDLANRFLQKQQDLPGLFHEDMVDFLEKSNLSNPSAAQLYRFHSYLGKCGYDFGNDLIDFVYFMRGKARQEIRRRFDPYFSDLTSVPADTLSRNSVFLDYLKITGEEFAYRPDHLLWLSCFLCDVELSYGYFSIDQICERINQQIEEYQTHEWVRRFSSENSTFFDANSIDDLDGRQFEFFVSDLLSCIGYMTEVTKASGDQGMDILARKNGIRYAVQTKKSSSPVGNKAVQEALHAKSYYKTDEAIVLTNNVFTPSAVNSSKETDVILWDRGQLLKFIDQANNI
nr:restriction endonuclease [Alkalicoccus halolimnae]